MLKFFQVKQAGMFGLTSFARYYKYGVGRSLSPWCTTLMWPLLPLSHPPAHGSVLRSFGMLRA
jgi:hypothetical protein